MYTFIHKQTTYIKTLNKRCVKYMSEGNEMFREHGLLHRLIHKTFIVKSGVTIMNFRFNLTCCMTFLCFRGVKRYEELAKSFSVC